VLVVGGRPGEPFSVSPWERSAEALRFWTTGDWSSAIEVLATQHAEDPANANILYNLACAECRDGRADAALSHLEGAVTLEPRFSTAPRTTGLAAYGVTPLPAANDRALARSRRAAAQGVAGQPHPRPSSRNAGTVVPGGDEQHGRARTMRADEQARDRLRASALCA
jgi:hypothetical protein